MFPVGRFDPSIEEQKSRLPRGSTKASGATKEKGRGKKRKPTSSEAFDDASGDGRRGPHRTTDPDSSVRIGSRNHTNSDIDQFSSAEPPIPAAAADDDKSDSSSVPTSSDDENTHASTTLKVIAPFQPPSDVSRKRDKMRIGTEETDEAIDDFDADFDIIENSAAQPSTDGGEGGSTTPSSSSQRRDAAANRALRLSQLPISEVASEKYWNLPPFLIQNLREDSYEKFFPIQCMVIPDVIESERNAHIRGARDVCCHAPTGSGKTLAFVIPLLTALHNETSTSTNARGLRRLRALVVLPGRDLAKQVYDVFVRYAKGSRIKIGLAVGGGKKRTDLINERRSLVVESYHESYHDIRDEDGAFLRRRNGGLLESAFARTRHTFDPTSIVAALEAFDGTLRKDNGLQVCPKMGGQSAVDILIATPGRLIDHLDCTPGFTLQHLKYLVVDEADRLVNQPYQNWVGRVLEASNASHTFNVDTHATSPLRYASDGMTMIIDPITHRSGAERGLPKQIMSEDDDTTNVEAGLVSGFLGRPVPLRKMLFSATLTQDPQKLARLGLDNPKHYDANFLKRSALDLDDIVDGDGAKAGRYFVPEGLTERMVECTAEQKPLVVLALLLDEEKNWKGCMSGERDTERVNLSIVFTSSVDSTHRLARLLQLLWEVGGYGHSSAIAEFSSSISAKQRAAILRRCRSSDSSQRVSVLVCSDGMSRGMDLPSVSAVINYDVPAFAKTYVHRCGRTARAGREGKAICILKGGQVSKFNKMRSLVGGGSVEKAVINKHLIKGVVPTYKACVGALQRVIEAENKDEILQSDPLDATQWMTRS